MHRGTKTWISSLLVVLLLVLSVAPVSAAPSPLSSDEAIQLLKSINLVRGDQSGDLRLGDTITRAEAATVFVRALGHESYAEMVKDAVPFEDTKGHWAAGYVTLAQRLKLMNGRSTTHFEPDAKITNAEVLTVVLRMVDREPAGPWNAEAIMEAAAQLGLAPEGMGSMLANLDAVRGVVFQALASAIFAIPTADGKTIAQKTLDGDAPSLELTVPGSALEEQVTVSGTVTDKSPVTVTVNGQVAEVSGNKFSTTIMVPFGTTTVTAVAKDAAGNTTTKTATVVRGGQIASIEVTGPDTVEAGKSVQLNVVAKDASGLTVPSSGVTATVPAGFGSYKSASGTFTAGANAGDAQLVFTSGSVTEEFTIKVLGKANEATALRIRSINNGKAASLNKSTKVEVEVVDAEGNLVTYDQGRTVTLTASGLSGVMVTDTTVQTVAGVATFSVLSSTAGSASFSVASTGLPGTSQSVVFSTNTRIVLTATPEAEAADGVSQSVIRAYLQDEDGDAVVNSTNEDILISLSTNSDDSRIVSSGLIIRKGTSNSGATTGSLVPGFVTEKVTVSGKVTSSHTFTVVPVSVSFTKEEIGPAAKLVLEGGGATYNPATSGPVTLRVRVTDADDNLVDEGSYGFQVEVRTSNEEAQIDGLPEDLTLTLGDGTDLVPVVGAEDAIVARTNNGLAELTLDYNKSGRVYLKLVTVEAKEEAYDDEGESDESSSSRSLDVDDERYVAYAGTPVAIELTVDLPGAKLVDQPIGVLPANGSAQAKIKAHLVDTAGGRIMEINKGSATLTKVDGAGTRRTGDDDDRVGFDDGVAEFSISATRTVDIDEWQVSVNPPTTGTLWPAIANQTITIVTNDEKPGSPGIIGIAGDSAYPNRVLVNDTYMEISFTDVSGYGYVKVYRSGSSTAIWTSEVLDFSETTYVRVPKEKLPSTSEQYQIVVNNGDSDSSKSLAWPTDGSDVVNETALEVDITSVQYDAEDTKLYVKASGISSGTINPMYLSINDVPLGDVQCTTGSGSFTCTGVELDAAELEGSAVLVANDGWFFRSSTGQTAEEDEDLSNNVVKPMGYISHGVVSFGTDSKGKLTASLTLYGKNLNQGRITLSKLSFFGDETMKLSSSTTTTVTPSSATSVTISVPNTAPSGTDSVAKRLQDRTGPEITLDAATGWLNSSGYTTGEILSIPVYAKVSITRVTYDPDTDTFTFLSPGGLENGTVNLEGFVVKNRSGEVLFALDSTDQVVNGNTLTDDREFQIKLHANHAKLIEGDADADIPSQRGKVFLSSKTNDLEDEVYWLQTEDGWYASELQHGTYKITW